MRGRAMLLERAAELAAVDTLLDALIDGRGGLLWIEGPAGIGKTELLDAARTDATAADIRVLSARASDLEREFPFGVVRGLFEPVLATGTPGERDALLAGAARLAEPVITLGPVAPAADDSASFGVLHGLYWLTANLADTGPVLLTVDDAHWADAPSLRALAYLVRRIAELPVGLLVTARTPTPDADRAVVEALAEEPVTVVLRPGPLGPASIEEMVRASLGGGAGDAEHGRAFRAACQEATGGNPLLVDALLTALARADVAPDDAGVAAVRERAPQIVASSVLSRLRHLSPDARRVAQAVAVLSRGAQLRHVAALTDLEPTAAAEAAESLVGAGLLAPGRPLAPAHPVIAEVVLGRMSPGERHQAHRTAARLLAAEGAAPELVAAHLMHTESLGDAEVVDTLRVAARTALAKGAPEAAMSYLRRALHEPPGPATRPDVLFELGSATVKVTFTEGVGLLEQAVRTATRPTGRALAALELARSLRTTLEFHRAQTVLDQAIEGLPDDEAELRHELEAEAVGLARRDPARRAWAEERTRQLLAVGSLVGRAGTVLLANSAVDTLVADGPRAVGLAERALAATLATDAPDPAVLLPATTVLIATERLEQVLSGCESSIASARRRGSIYDFASASVLRAQVRYLQGALGDAEADARLADELTAEHQVVQARRYTQAWLVLTLVERGQLAEAQDSLDKSGVTPNLVYLLDARGRLRLAQGRAEEALADFRECGLRLERRGLDHPGLMPWRANAALALHQLGRVEEAGCLVEEAVTAARSYRAPRALGIALRVHGLVAGSVPAVREAVAVLESTTARLEHARALVDLGAALRRGNHRHAARDPLAHGRELAHHCGADALVERAREELAATGARPRRVARSGADALTPSERRVAELVAGGMSNREVAQALFVSGKTVETHLGSVYRKLAVARRADLAAALA